MVTAGGMFVVLAIAVLAAGCTRFKDRSGKLRGVNLQTVTLQTRHTGVGDLQIKLPPDYAAEWTEEAKHDKFFIYRPTDTGEVQRGMLIVNITPQPAKSIEDTAVYEKVNGKMGEFDVQWRERTVVDEEDSSKLYQREMSTRDPFAAREQYHDMQGLVLHVFVVGSDEKEVERLAASAETIRVLPMKPNL